MTQFIHKPAIEDVLYGFFEVDEFVDVETLPRDLKDLKVDSREVLKGDVFVAYKGIKEDGRDYIRSAIKNGAELIIAEKSAEWPIHCKIESVPVLVVEGLLKRLSKVAGNFYRHPSRSLKVLGVTGTNGKTSVTQIYMQLLNSLSKSCGVIGTLGYGLNGELVDSINTTPSAIVIQSQLSQFLEKHVEYVGMEVSSHGLDQYRVRAIQFDIAVFTNLSRDHLDYHGSMEAYTKAKMQLFDRHIVRYAVLNFDDPVVEQLISRLHATNTVSLSSYSCANESADIYAKHCSWHSNGVDFILSTPFGEIDISSPLIGSFNLSNLLAVIASILNQGFSLQDIARAVANLQQIPGRMQRVNVLSDVQVVIDYAHTPDALEKALAACKNHTDGKLICVFGCGGQRDRGKRPLMGQVVEATSDVVYITSDNPRNENPEMIINDISVGMKNKKPIIFVDRGEAIRDAIQNANAGDVVLIAGKGHEQFIEINNTKISFSDYELAEKALLLRVQS